MGDMADWLHENAMWVEFYGDPHPGPPARIGCAYCGTGDLVWGVRDGRWRLFRTVLDPPGVALHECPPVDPATVFTPVPE